MFGSLLKSTIGIATDVTKVALAPVAIAAEVTRAATKPIADGLEEVANDVREELTDKNAPR